VIRVETDEAPKEQSTKTDSLWDSNRSDLIEILGNQAVGIGGMYLVFITDNPCLRGLLRSCSCLRQPRA
jgi:hypothetical protein